MKYRFRPSAEKQFAKLDPETQSKIVHKLAFFLSTPSPLAFAKRMKHYDSGQYRFRIGDLRIVFDVIGEEIVVHAVGHGRDIYKK